MAEKGPPSMWRGQLGHYFRIVWVKDDCVLNKSYKNSYGDMRMDLLCILQIESTGLAEVLDGHGGREGSLLVVWFG